MFLIYSSSAKRFTNNYSLMENSLLGKIIWKSNLGKVKNSKKQYFSNFYELTQLDYDLMEIILLN